MMGEAGPRRYVGNHLACDFQVLVRDRNQQGDDQVLQRNDAHMQRREFGVAHLGKRRFSLAGMRRGLWAVRLCTTLIDPSGQCPLALKGVA